MIRKRLNLVVILVCLLNVIFLSTVAFNGRPASAATKRVYKSEMVPTGSIQATLDERAAEGWQLVAASSHSTSVNTDITVLIFEKQ